MAVSTAGMVSRRRFGEALKAARENAQRPDGWPVKQIDAAKAIKRRTIDRVSRFERGAAWPEPAELEALLKLYGADLETCVRLRTMLKEGQAITRTWWQEYEEDFPSSLIRFIAYEDAASSLTVLGTGTVPALLQTEDYARAVTAGVASSVLPPLMVERAVELRRRRRGIFDKPTPTRVEFVVSEAALHQEIGGRDVMVAQLQALLDDAKKPSVILRVIPFGAPATASHITHLLEFSGADAKPIAAYDSPTGLSFQTRLKEVREAKSVIEALRRVALSPRDSVEFIRDIKDKKENARA